MTDKEPVAERLLTADETPATAWAAARERLEAPNTYWLATVRPDGRPHVVPLLAIWLDNTLYFCASGASRKAKNLELDSHCVLSANSLTLPALDLVLEGSAVKVNDDTTLQRVADAYKVMMDWPVTVRDGGFYGDSAPTAGPPPYYVYEFTPTVAFGLPGTAGTDSAGQGPAGMITPTRWRF
ncbi:MAG: pyridoxamine 5'-phosphate oxidase family protein [Chloroflexota bacterium]|nr:pyridoxamine 5'-phosphate oxidase family protein [Chloroflexota bacterium]